jgi:Tol biopolymer transport system component
MTIDPESLRAIAVDRLTTGPGPDVRVAISADGRRLAFTAMSQTVRNWLFTFDATAGRLSNNGRAISAQGRIALEPTLSRDGKMVAFCVGQSGRFELWGKSLLDGREAPVITDEYDREYPQWSPDGMQLAYTRYRPNTSYENQLMVWSSESRSEEPLTAWGNSNPERVVYDWSPDGKSLLISQPSVDSREEVWLLPVASAPNAETAARKIVSDPRYDLWQAHFSPNGRWIVFEAVANSPKAAQSALFVVPAAGGSWTRITEGKPWDDKPRWSPDGKTIYFVSSRGGYFNVWGIRFDPAKGKPVGEPFRVSKFESPSLMVPLGISPVALSLTEDKLVLTLQESSGGIWVLDNVDR